MSVSQLKSHTGPTGGPSSWVIRWAATLRPGCRVLDFAAGSGRNLPPLLERDAVITAADRDRNALAAIAAFAPAVTRIEADLENGAWPFDAGSFDAIVCCNFLHRPRLDLLFGLLAPGGLMVYETFAQGNERFGRPSNPAFLLAPGELVSAATRNGLQVLGYEHGYTGPGRPAVVQRLAAVRREFVAEQYPLVG